MTVFLTSHTGGYIRVDGRRVPAPLIPDNGFTEQLKRRWKPDARMLFIAADPNNHAKSDAVRDAFAVSFPMSSLPVKEIAVCDSRSEAEADRLGDYDVLILSGGHVPTQNAFFARIGLRDKLQGYDGLVIGISAGTMNCAETVYAQPELDGEAIDPDYQRFFPGLGLTKLMILPHYQNCKDDVLDGLRVFEDIAYPDSHSRAFYALVDGSYVIAEDGRETLHGEAYRIADGSIKKISGSGDAIRLSEI